MDNRRTVVARIRSNGFTLIELLVVIAIIALLVTILMPSLNRAKDLARQAVCAGNMHSVGQSVNVYHGEYGYYPPSYVYPRSDGTWGTGGGQQDPTKPLGYQHWSWLVLEVSGKAEHFQCPAMSKGGHPRTNPGPKAEDWEEGQVDDRGNRKPDSPTGGPDYVDLQPARVAFTASALVIPRNKFTTQFAYGGPRTNKLVRPEDIDDPGKTILCTEFNDNWKALQVETGQVKSHRPVQPFVHLSVATDRIYNDMLTRSGFRYPAVNTGNLMSYEQTLKQTNLITSNVEVNIIGRHHPGEAKLGEVDMGGKANFLFCAGNTEGKHVMDTLRDRDWGEYFYSITGENEVGKHPK